MEGAIAPLISMDIILIEGAIAPLKYVDKKKLKGTIVPLLFINILIELEGVIAPIYYICGLFYINIEWIINNIIIGEY